MTTQVTPPPVPPLAPTFADQFPVSWLKAVLLVYIENREAELNGTAEFGADADVWIACGEVKKEGWRRAEAHWLAITGLTRDVFGISRNGFMVVYKRYRKRNDRERLAYCAEFGVAVPAALKAQMVKKAKEVEKKKAAKANGGNGAAP